MRVEGQVNTPQTQQEGGVITTALTGNITGATLNDLTPTADETEIFYATPGSNGNEIAAVNADGSAPARSLIANMGGPAEKLAIDPSGKYVYYIRSSNLQRTNILDGTSNTILGAVESYSFNQSGSKICYKKKGTDELWSANPNGTGQVLVAHYSTTVKVVGFQSDTTIALQDAAKFQTIDLSSGTLGTTRLFMGYIFFDVSFDPSERVLYIYCSTNGPTFVVFRMEVPTLNGLWNAFAMYISPNTLSTSFLAPGPEQNFAGVDDTTGRLTRYDSDIKPIFSFPRDTFSREIAWAGNRTVVPLVGTGTAFANGVGALICSERGKVTPSVLAADAVTRSSMSVTSLNDGASGSPVYRIDCDNLKALAYANRNSYLWQSILSGASGLKGAIVSFDSETGFVSSAVTFAKKPTVTRVGKGWKIEGDMVDVIAGDGRRRAASRKEVLR